MDKVLVISVKPEFAQKIINGAKTIELRKSAPKIKVGDNIIIYSTIPEKAFVGTCKLKRIIKDDPANLWASSSSELGITYDRYNEYFKGTNLAVGIELTEVKALELKIPLSCFYTINAKFKPPQTFGYITIDEFKQLIEE